MYQLQEAPTKKWLRADIVKDEDSTIEYFKTGGLNSFFTWNSIPVGGKLAAWLLTLNVDSGRINHTRVKYWVEKMKAKEYYYMGGYSSIHLDWDGHLIDCHNRLAAIASTGIVARFDIHTHMNPDMRSIIRANEGIIPAATIIPVAKVVEPKEELKYSPRPIRLIMSLESGVLKKGLLSGRISFRLDKVAEWIKENDSELLENSIAEGDGLSTATGRFLTSSEWSAIRYCTAKVDADDSSMFFAMLRNKYPLSGSHPITILKKKFGATHVYADSSSIVRMATAIIAWNYYRTETPLVDIVWTEDMEFPKIK